MDVITYTWWDQSQSMLIKAVLRTSSISHKICTRLGCPLLCGGCIVSSYQIHRRNLPFWRHQVETFSALLPFCKGIPPVTGVFPSQRPATPSFDVFCAWTKGWANNRDAGDMRHHRAHYGFTIMTDIPLGWFTGTGQSYDWPNASEVSLKDMGLLPDT